MTKQAHAVEVAGRIHTLHPASWPRGDHRAQWKWRAYVDGIYWRLFRTVAEWMDSVNDYAPAYTNGPHAAASYRAQRWSEHEGRVLLERLGWDK